MDSKDVLIIGGGGTGLAAAVTSARLGKRVAVLEMRKTLGGNTSRAEGIFAADSPAQRRNMIKAPADELFRFAMDYSHWQTDPRIVRAFIDRSGDTIGWLEDMGLAFDWIPPYYPGQPFQTWHLIHGGGTGEKVVSSLIKECEKLGVEFFLNTRARHLIFEDGRVCGVEAETENGKAVFAAKAVVIGTGGFAANKELLEKYCPYYFDGMTCYAGANNGDGLVMCLEAGAATEGLGLLFLNGPRFTGDFMLNGVCQEPGACWVNKQGRRYYDESSTFRFERAYAVTRQPDHISFTVFDSAIKERIRTRGLDKGIGVMIKPGTVIPDLDSRLESEIKKGNVFCGENHEELAEKAGIPADVFVKTIEEYNCACASGRDPIFAKQAEYLVPIEEGPFYAIRCESSFLSTIGGIRINENMEVMASDGSVIRGLYAGGVDAGGWEMGSYNCVLSGSCAGFALSSGRIAGENASGYIDCIK